MPETLRTTTQNPAFPALPPHLERAAANLPIGELLAEIVERYGGDIAHTRVLGQVTHDFIIGRVKAKTLVMELVRRFGISEEDARTIARELYETVFEPLGERLKALPPSRPLVLQPLPSQVRPTLPPTPPPPPAPPLEVKSVAPPPPRPIVPPSRPAPVVPSRPVLRPTPPPPVTETEAGLTLERMLVGLPPELRSAVRNIPLRRTIYDLGREHHMTIEEIGQLAEGVLEFIAGKTHREDLLATLTRLVRGDRTQAAAASDELNVKVFGPIREAMKRATEPPPPPPKPPAPPMAKKLEPLIIYPLSMARPPAGIMNHEAETNGHEAPAPRSPVAEPFQPLSKPPAPPVVSHVEPPPTLPVYEELRDRAHKEFEEFREAQPKPAPQPPPAKPLGPDPYREPME